MKKINIKGKTYTYASDFRKDDFLRSSFNKLTQKVYKFDFEVWYQNGYWGERYIPYSLLEGDTMVSNVSVNLIDFLVLGEKRTYVQIGTVMTDPAYRNKGLNRVLIEQVLEEWKGKCDLIYLFANNTVLDFYPKFGFKRADEYQYSKKINSFNTNSKPQKLKITKKSTAFLIKKINKSVPHSKISMINNASLAMFYLTSTMAENIYYIEKFDAVIIADYKQETLFLYEIFSEQIIEIEKLLATIIIEGIERVVFGFTPNDTSSLEEKIHTPDDVLFILDDKWGVFSKARLQFPVLSHA